MTVEILAIDPGPAQSGWCIYDGSRMVQCGVADNATMLVIVKTASVNYRVDRLAIEMIASYGMAVGREVFETCVWIGRFQQAWGNPDAVELVYRKDVKMHLCGTPRAKDANIRQALLDMFPPSGGGAVPQVGTKKEPGPLYGISSHAWPALGVAITAMAASQMKRAA